MPRRKITEAQVEKAARALMHRDGFETSSPSLLEEAKRGNPRVSAWVADARAALKAAL